MHSLQSACCRNAAVLGVTENTLLIPGFDLGSSRIIRFGQWDVGAWGVNRGLPSGWIVGSVLLRPSGHETTGPSVGAPGANLNRTYRLKQRRPVDCAWDQAEHIPPADSEPKKKTLVFVSRRDWGRGGAC